MAWPKSTEGFLDEPVLPRLRRLCEAGIIIKRIRYDKVMHCPERRRVYGIGWMDVISEAWCFLETSLVLLLLLLVVMMLMMTDRDEIPGSR